MSHVGVIVIGRNEAHNLRRCLSSVMGKAAPIVYVDSGSEDGSADLARAMGVNVVELDRSAPFTVARARNEGFAQVARLDPEVEFIQFVDGDSEMNSFWFEQAKTATAERPEFAVVFGRLRERFPQRSLYNRLYQIDWDPRVGESNVCGGMAMMRAGAFRQVGGFNPARLAFEDYELCFRLRREGWRILRLDAEMAVHEAAMTRFGEWWRREARAGHARAHEAQLHGRASERYSVRECRSIWFWGLVLPSLAMAAIWLIGGTSVVLLAGYPALFYRIYRRMRRRTVGAQDAALYAAFCVLGKFPQVLGQIRFHFDKVRLAFPINRQTHSVRTKGGDP